MTLDEQGLLPSHEEEEDEEEEEEEETEGASTERLEALLREEREMCATHQQKIDRLEALLRQHEEEHEADVARLRKVTTCFKSVVSLIKNDEDEEGELVEPTCLIATLVLPYVVVVLVLYCATHVEFHQLYALGGYCPLVNNAAGVIASDPVVLAMTKSYCSKLCDYEDSAWHFFTDAWVRTVVTGTDSWYLLLMQLPGVFLATAFFFYLAPVVSSVYAGLAYYVQMLELQLHGSWCPVCMERALYCFEAGLRVVMLGVLVVCRSSPLPCILRGFREQLYTGDDLVEDLKDAWCTLVLCTRRDVNGGQVVRELRRHAVQSSAQLMKQGKRLVEQGLLLGVSLVVYFRSFCLWLGPGNSVVRFLQKEPPFASFFERHSQLLPEGIVADSISSQYLLDPLFNVFIPRNLNVPALVIAAFVACIVLDLTSLGSTAAEKENKARQLAAIELEAETAVEGSW